MAYDDKGTDKEVKSLKARHPEKPPAAIKAEIEAMKQEKATEAGMKAHEKRRLAKGGFCYVTGGSVKGAGIAQRGVRQCKVM